MVYNILADREQGRKDVISTVEISHIQSQAVFIGTLQSTLYLQVKNTFCFEMCCIMVK
jgi:hypothetical protein